MDLALLPIPLAVCQLSGNTPPIWAEQSEFYSFIRTQEECSLVCDQALIKGELKAETGWRALKIQGPLAFNEIGILASIAGPLAKAKVSIFVLSTFDTDYILIKEGQLSKALKILSSQGHSIQEDT